MATDLNERIAENVRARLAGAGIAREDYYLGSGMSERTGARRLTGKTSWTTDELAATARFLDVPLSALLTNVDEIVRTAS
jgi:hypothetical protein